MYTLDGTFAEVVCFIEAYTSGLAGAGKLDHPLIDQWTSFGAWLHPRFDCESAGGGWQGKFIALRRGCSDDPAAFALLLELFGRYRESTQ